MKDLFLKDLLTIVIPCKNESDIIHKTLDLLNYQNKINGIEVVVCDNSDDENTKASLRARATYKHDKFKLFITTGGLPARARNLGFKHVSTPYVLFLDADVFMINPNIIQDALVLSVVRDLHLTTVKFRSDSGKFNYVYKTFDQIQNISKWSTPFCLGGFMLIKSDKFREIGGFDEYVKIAEDYQFSKMINHKKFGRLNQVVFTSPRRFENKGVLYMLKLMLGSFFNHKNKKWFTEDKNYWK